MESIHTNVMTTHSTYKQWNLNLKYFIFFNYSSVSKGFYYVFSLNKSVCLMLSNLNSINTLSYIFMQCHVNTYSVCMQHKETKS